MKPKGDDRPMWIVLGNMTRRQTETQGVVSARETSALNAEADALLVRPITPDGSPVTSPVEGPMTFGQRAEETVEEIKPDAEICVHETFDVHATMMNVVEAARIQEPPPQKWNPGHPEVIKMHAIVK